MLSELRSFDFTSRIVQAFPQFIIENNYEDVTDGTKTPFQKAFDTDLHCFSWLAQHPEQVEEMQQVMKSFRSGDWLQGFDELEKEALDANQNPERVFLVDVGGGSGHQCVEVRDRYPGLHGRLVVQDLPEVVKEVPEIPGVKIEANDMFQEQKVKGKKLLTLISKPRPADPVKEPNSTISAASSTTGPMPNVSRSCRTCGLL